MGGLFGVPAVLMNELARAWLLSPPVSLRDSAVRALVQAAQRGVLGLRWCPVERDPYRSHLEMAERYVSDARLDIYADHSSGLPWDERANWTMRAAHDRDHIRHGFPFTATGELHAARLAASRLPGLAWVYASEVAGQAAVASATGAFAPQKIVCSRVLTRALEL